MCLKTRLLPEQVVEGTVFRLHPSTRFAVSRCGQVLGRTGRLLKIKSQGRYGVVGYQADTGSIRHLYVHRMVAEVWCPNPHDYPEVNHVDGDKRNNAAANLEWVTRSGNVKHAIAMGLNWNLPQAGQRGFQCA